jgi:serine/tyrosine/threonine adenylyltransferase
MPMTSFNRPHPDQLGFCFDNSYSKLPEVLFAHQHPKRFSSPSLVIFNHALAKALGLNTKEFESTDWAILSGKSLPVGANPIAQAYAGHQFGYFSYLGDGRAILLGEHIGTDQKRVDIQLKGSGPTQYSRSGDGLAALGPMLREYLMSEAMHALGVPTTRSLAVMLTGEVVYRAEPLSGAVLTRVAASHIRVGTFQYAASIDDKNVLKTLADYTINRHFPELNQQANRYLGLLNAVIDAQANLIANWMGIGFIHGVMNTDNMSIPGETIDYGPCAFINAYHPQTVFSSIDKDGRYAFGNQPMIAEWNLTRLAESLLPLIDENQPEAIKLAVECLDQYQDKFRAAWLNVMRKKLGLFNTEADDLSLAEDLLMLMYKHQADYTNTFRNLVDLSQLNAHESNCELMSDGAFKNWSVKWHERRSRQAESMQESQAFMDSHNPSVIPRNHLVEEVLERASNGDMLPFHDFLKVLATPYTEPKDKKYLFGPDAKFDNSYRTFCGT